MADKDPSPKDKEETLYPAVPMVILVVYQLQFHKVFHCLLFYRDEHFLFTNLCFEKCVIKDGLERDTFTVQIALDLLKD